jgi:carboxypeptidase family protein
VVGRILAPSGTPIQGARAIVGNVNAKGWRMEDGHLVPSARPIQVLSDANGCFEAHGLLPGRTNITAMKGGYAQTRTAVEVVAGLANEVDIHMEPEYLLSGVVRDSAGIPVEGVKVEVLSPFSRFTLTDSFGRYSLGGLRALKYVAYAHGDIGGFASSIVEPAQDADWSPTLQSGEMVSGRIVDEDGLPIPGLVVLLEPTEDKDWWVDANGNEWEWGATRADEEGVFVVHGCHSGVHLLEVRRYVGPGTGAYAICAIQEIRPSGLEQIVTVLKEDMYFTMLRVEVSDAAGVPIIGAQVHIEQRGGTPYATRTLRPHVESTASGSDGVAVYRRIPLELYDLEVSAEGFNLWEGVVDCKKLIPPTDDGTLVAVSLVER